VLRNQKSSHPVLKEEELPVDYSSKKIFTTAVHVTKIATIATLNTLILLLKSFSLCTALIVDMRLCSQEIKFKVLRVFRSPE
jgi:hypothetical protein